MSRHDDGVIRIASVAETLHVGGDENRLLSFGRHLDHSRFSHVVVIAHSSDDERDRRLGAMMTRYERAGIEVVVQDAAVRARRHRPETPRMRALGLDAATSVRWVRRLARLFREREIDVVDARLEVGTLYAVPAARLARVPAVVSTSYSPERWSGPLKWAAGQAVFAGVDAFVSDADVTVDEYRRWSRLHPPTYHCIPNGLTPARAVRSPEQVRAELGLPARVPVIGQLSRVIPRKGHPVLLRAARRVLDVHPDVHVLICGFAEDPAYAAELLALAGELGIADRVVVTAYPGEAGDVLGAIDVFAHLSTFDSSPIAVHESMSAGLPAVVSRVGGTAELVEDGVSGLLVPTEDDQAAAAALLRLLDDPALAASLGSAARARYERRHRPEAMAAAHEELFTEVLARKGRRRLPVAAGPRSVSERR